MDMTLRYTYPCVSLTHQSDKKFRILDSFDNLENLDILDDFDI